MLALRSLFFTIVIPGTVTVLIPYLILSRNPTSREPWTLMQAPGVLLMIIGAAVLFWCIWDFTAKGRGTLAPIDPPRQLVVQGLYRYVRNPMYLGVFLLLLGEAAFFESIAILQYALLWFLLINLIVLFHEERVLRNRFGDSYDRYRHSVNRWLPSRPAPRDY